MKNKIEFSNVLPTPKWTSLWAAALETNALETPSSVPTPIFIRWWAVGHHRLLLASVTESGRLG